MRAFKIAGLLMSASAMACADGRAASSDENVNTLVRSSATDSDTLLAATRPPGKTPLRIHVATYDADEGGAYNAENCETARTLFMGQPGVTVR